MFLPALMIADRSAPWPWARYMVVTSPEMVQITFFSTMTIVVMMSMKIPVSLNKLIVCFELSLLCSYRINQGIAMHLF